MVKRTLAAVLTIALVACSSDGGEDDPGYVHNEINKCATRGASYLVKMKEQPGGTCGAVADTVLNIEDPGITAAHCASVTQANCVANGTSCKSTIKGCEQTITYRTLFFIGGGEGSGSETLSVLCSDGTSCYSKYDYTFTRQ